MTTAVYEETTPTGLAIGGQAHSLWPPYPKSENERCNVWADPQGEGAKQYNLEAGQPVDFEGSAIIVVYMAAPDNVRRQDIVIRQYGGPFCGGFRRSHGV